MSHFNINIKKESLTKRLFILNFIIGSLFAILGGIFLFTIQKDGLLLDFTANLFSDFTQVIKFSLSENPFLTSIGTSYPPLAVLIIYFPFALICKNVAHLGFVEILFTAQFWISFLLFFCLSFAATSLLFKKFVNLRGKYFVFFALSLVLNGASLYMIARGNIILYALIFILFFLVYYKSENKVVRELALLSLAIAGAIKIYPLFFGVLLLKEKKLFQAGRVAVYSVILFFLPFLFFKGGFSNITLFFSNLGDFSLSGERLLELRNLSAAGIVYKAFSAIGQIFNAETAEASEIVSIIVTILIACVAAVGALLSKDNLSLHIICAAAILLIPSVSYFYCAVFLLIPLAEFINEYESLPAGRKRFYLSFFIICTCIFLGEFASFISLFLIAALFYEVIKSLIDYNGGKRQKIILQGNKLL